MSSCIHVEYIRSLQFKHIHNKINSKNTVMHLLKLQAHTTMSSFCQFFKSSKRNKRLNTVGVPWASWCRGHFPYCSANAAVALYDGQKDKDKFVSFLRFISFFDWPWGLPAAPSASCSDLMGEGCGKSSGDKSYFLLRIRASVRIQKLHVYILLWAICVVSSTLQDWHCQMLLRKRWPSDTRSPGVCL